MAHYYPPVGVPLQGRGARPAAHDDDVRFTEVGGLSMEMGTEEVPEGGENRFVQKYPVRAKYPELVLKRGLLGARRCSNGSAHASTTTSIVPKDVDVKLLNDEHQPLMTWHLVKAYPTKWALTDLNATGNSVAVETLQLFYQYFTVDADSCHRWRPEVPIIVDEVVISVEVTNQASGGAPPAPGASRPRSGRRCSASASSACSTRFAQGGALTMPVADRGTLEHLIIQRLREAGLQGTPADGSFEAYVNPSEITLGYEIEYDSAQRRRHHRSRMEFKKIKPGELSLSFFIDGTGANGRTVDVQPQGGEVPGGHRLQRQHPPHELPQGRPGARCRSSVAC